MLSSYLAPRTLLGWAVLVMAVLAVGCQTTEDTPDAAIPGLYTYNFQLTSSNTSLMPAAGKVVVLSSPSDAFCGNVSPVQDFTSTLIGTLGGPVTIAYSVQRNTYFWYSIYIDTQPDGVLSSSDNVWGTSATNIAGECIRPLGNTTDNTAKVWDTLGTTIGAGGTTTYTGATQAY